MVRVLDVVERAAEDDPPAIDQRDAVGHALDLVEQVRREEDRSPFLGDRADDRAEDVAADDRVEAARRLVEHEQFRPVGQGEHQAGARPLALREVLHLGRRIEGERVAQFLGEGRVPVRVERARVAE